jgi:Zn-dependent alcohol dehydrogenase
MGGERVGMCGATCLPDYGVGGSEIDAVRRRQRLRRKICATLMDPLKLAKQGTFFIKTRAAVAWKAEARLTIETVDIEGPKAGDALIEIMATGVCHGDADTLSGLDSEGKFPAILGHEGAGIVREIGAGVTRGRTDAPKIVDWRMEGKINIDDLIAHTMPLDKINDAFDLMHKGESIRSVVIY